MSQSKFRILVTGSRDWPDYDKVEAEIFRAITEARQYILGDFDEVTIVEGACPTGADDMAYKVFQRLEANGRPVISERHPADWAQYGKRAGFLRNAAMVTQGADIVLAFIKDESKGASMTARLADEAGLEVRLFTL